MRIFSLICLIIILVCQVVSVGCMLYKKGYEDGANAKKTKEIIVNDYLLHPNHFKVDTISNNEYKVEYICLK